VYLSDRDHGEVTYNIEDAYLDELLVHLDNFNILPSRMKNDTVSIWSEPEIETWPIPES
jgi:hypothetical protein